jgi:hypothetical protein
MSPPPDMAPSPLARACSDAISAIYTAPDGLPAWDETHRGDVVRCAPDRVLTAAQLNTAVQGLGYQGPPLPSGATVYRVTYRTERLMATQGGLTSALVLIPDTPHAGGGVLVVAGHGTVGLGPQCAPSTGDLTDPSYGSSHLMPLATAGYGYTVIAPDYAGFGFGSVSGWALSADEAHSLLDGTRAMKQLLAPWALPSKVAIIGHSQGGHAVLSTQALAGTYGLEGQLVGIAAFAPLWLNEAAWGAVTDPTIGFTTHDNAVLFAFGLIYFYGHGELYDGPGGGVAMFQSSKQAMVKQMVTSECLDQLIADVPSLGMVSTDFYDPTFATDVGTCGFSGDCSQGAATTWHPRFKADRPTIDGKGAPIVIWQGAKDTTVTPGYAQCGFDRITADLAAQSGATATLTVCGDPNADHGGAVRDGAAWVNQWIAARALGAPEPPACPGVSAIGSPTCTNPPPNMD